MKRRRPFSAARTCEVISKVILFYSVFYVVMKVINIFSRDGVMGLPLPNLILCIPFVIFGLVGFNFVKKNHYSWIYVALGVIFISLVRYFNNSGEIILWLSQNL